MPIRSTNTQQMSLDEMLAKREELNSSLITRVDDELKELEERVQKLRSFKMEMELREGGTAVKGRKLPPKYRNPENPEETWAGRGVYPKWLEKALKTKGRKIEDFRIKE